MRRRACIRTHSPSARVAFRQPGRTGGTTIEVLASATRHFPAASARERCPREQRIRIVECALSDRVNRREGHCLSRPSGVCRLGCEARTVEQSVRRVTATRSRRSPTDESEPRPCGYVRSWCRSLPRNRCGHLHVDPYQVGERWRSENSEFGCRSEFLAPYSTQRPLKELLLHRRSVRAAANVTTARLND